MNKVEDWELTDKRKADYLSNWSAAACIATNKKIGKATSQLSSWVSDIDITDDAFEEYSDSFLLQIMVAWNIEQGYIGSGDGGTAHQPVINVIIPTMP